MTHDPKTQPQRGDILVKPVRRGKKPTRYRKRAVIAAADRFFSISGPHHDIFGSVLYCEFVIDIVNGRPNRCGTGHLYLTSIKSWQRWAKSADVLTASPEIQGDKLLDQLLPG